MPRAGGSSNAAAVPSYVGRLAPAPTGALHLGNARTFLVAWLRARKAGGGLILRLEDLDHPKVKPAAAREAYLDLAWLGIDWERGPAASFPPYPPTAAPDDSCIQSNRLDRYAEALGGLRERGLVYPCVCSRKELDAVLSAPNAGDDLLERRYPGRCRGRFATLRDAAAAADGREPGWRFRVEAGDAFSFMDGFHGWRTDDLSAWSGDFLVARGERAGYQLAVVVDDAAMRVTEVVRGDDLLPSTQRQLALYRALGLNPPAFYHVPLVVGPDGRRLAKRHGDARLSPPRRAGRGPERVLGWLARSLGWLDALREIDIGETLAICDFAAIPAERPVATPEDLHWMGLGG